LRSSDVGSTDSSFGGQPDGVRSTFHTRDINPFETNTPWQTLEILLFIPMLPVLMVRLALVGLAFGLASCFVTVAAILPKPMQRTAILPLKWCARLVLYAFGFWWIEEEGLEENGDANVGIICGASHASLLDVFYYAYRWLPSFVAKRDIREMPFIGWFAEVLNSVFVDRHADAKTKAEYKSKIESIAENPKAPPVLIFPEGTCTNGKSLITFKRGSFEPGVDLLPVCMQYNSRMNPASVGRNSHLLFLVRVMMQWTNKLHVQVLPVHKPTEEEKDDPILFAEHVQDTMGDAMGIPKTRHSIADMFFYQQVVDQELPEKIFQFIFADLYEYFLLRDRQERKAFRHTLMHLLDRWHQVDRDSDGKISKSEFLHYAQQAGISENIGEAIFLQFDVLGNDSVDFLELAAACFELLRLAEFVVYENPEGIGPREIRDAYRFYRGSLGGVSRESVETLLKRTAGLDIPVDILDTHFPDRGEFSVIGLRSFSKFYLKEKNYLKLPFAVASVLVNHVLEVPEISELPQEHSPQNVGNMQ
jgi:lysophosphatidylcholine acyltransferase/lyso-PAF acetyltransferase